MSLTCQYLKVNKGSSFSLIRSINKPMKRGWAGEKGKWDENYRFNRFSEGVIESVKHNQINSVKPLLKLFFKLFINLYTRSALNCHAFQKNMEKY